VAQVTEVSRKLHPSLFFVARVRRTVTSAYRLGGECHEAEGRRTAQCYGATDYAGQSAVVTS
jgi:hypothetical protein